MEVKDTSFRDMKGSVNRQGKAESDLSDLLCHFNFAWRIMVKENGIIYMDTIVLTVEHNVKEAIKRCYTLCERNIYKIEYLGECCDPNYLIT